jgi:hypothetical protein
MPAAFTPLGALVAEAARAGAARAPGRLPIRPSRRPTGGAIAADAIRTAVAARSPFTECT